MIPHTMPSAHTRMSALPERYRKLVIREVTGQFRSATEVVWQPWVDPGPDEVAVRNHFAGCNAIFGLDEATARGAGGGGDGGGAGEVCDPFDGEARRIMHRTQIKGSGAPTAFAA